LDGIVGGTATIIILFIQQHDPDFANVDLIVLGFLISGNGNKDDPFFHFYINHLLLFILAFDCDFRIEIMG
jgi:hypothetical protein